MRRFPILLIVLLTSVAHCMWYGEHDIDEYLTFAVNTSQFSTGAGFDAAAVPQYGIYEDETAAEVVGPAAMAKLDDAGTVGFYTERLQLTDANFDAGKMYTIYITATVDGVAATTYHAFKMRAAPIATATALATVDTNVDDIETDTAAMDSTTELRTLMTGADTPVAKESTLTTIDTNVDDIETDTAAMDSTTELRTLLTGADTPLAKESTLTSMDGKLDTIDTNVDDIETDTAAYDTDGEYATAIWNALTNAYGGAGTYGQVAEDTLADTGELQTNQGNWATATSVGLSDNAITAAKVTDAAWQELIELLFSFDATGAYGDQSGSVVDQISDNVSGSGTTPVAVWSYGTRILTGLDEDNTTIDIDGSAVGSVTSDVTTDAASRTASKADVSALATSSALSTHDGKLDTVDNFLDTEVADIIDMLKAVLSKAYTLLTAVGTYDPATDSLEAQQENPQGPPIID